MVHTNYCHLLKNVTMIPVKMSPWCLIKCHLCQVCHCVISRSFSMCCKSFYMLCTWILQPVDTFIIPTAKGYGYEKLMLLEVNRIATKYIYLCREHKCLQEDIPPHQCQDHSKSHSSCKLLDKSFQGHSGLGMGMGVVSRHIEDNRLH